MSKPKAAKKRSARDNRRDDDASNVVSINPRQRSSKSLSVSHDGDNGDRRKLVCRNKAQTNYLQKIESNQLVFGVGPAGTGKSFVATMYAAQQLEAKRIRRFIVCRPAVEAGESLGFLPGEIEDKWAPYFRPIRDILVRYFGQNAVDCMLKNGSIEMAPIAYLRGQTFEDAIVLLDEAQNCTVGQMKLFLTRIGEHCTVIVDGDTDQVDIKEASGLQDAIQRFDGMDNCAIQEFNEDDIVRSGLVRDIIKRYRKTEAPASTKK